MISGHKLRANQLERRLMQDAKQKQGDAALMLPNAAGPSIRAITML